MKKPHIFVATHHKAGTVWMYVTFERLAQRVGLPFVFLNEGEAGWVSREDKLGYLHGELERVEGETELPGVFFEYHSKVPDLSACVGARGAKGLRIVRDPRDMLISAVHYHQRSDEAWLDESMPSLGGMTFREKLVSYECFGDQLSFEMDHYMGDAIRELSCFDEQGVFMRVKYEDLIVDYNMELWHKVLIWLELEGEDLIRGMSAFWESSIFGGLKKMVEGGEVKHVRNGGGSQWKSVLSARELDLIQDRHGDDIVKLGYELG